MLRALVWNNQADVILMGGNGIARPDSDQNNGIDLSKSHSPFFSTTIEPTCHKRTLHMIVYYIIDWHDGRDLRNGRCVDYRQSRSENPKFY